MLAQHRLLGAIVALLFAPALVLAAPASPVAGQDLGVRCMNPDTGYTVGVPVGWYYNLHVEGTGAAQDVAACRFFSPNDFTITPGSEPTGIAIAIGQQTGTIDPSEGTTTTVDGHDAVVYETTTDPATYVYEIALAGDQILVASTSSAWVGSYAENKAYLDEMMDSLEWVAPSVRLAGATRYGTAAVISSANFGTGQGVVYVATGEKFPDALAGSPVAGIAQSPILLVTRDTIPAPTAAELQRLNPSRIVVLGGPAVVSNPVAAQLANYATTGQVDRLWGDNRYQTAVDISRENFAAGVARAYIATGEKFPDALAGGALAGQIDGPMLLVRPGEIPAVTADELERLEPADIVVLGGPEAVSNEVAAALAGYTAGEVHRLWGPTRYGTAADIADWTYDPGVAAVYIATGEDFPDALTAGPAAVSDDAPILLVEPNSVPSETADMIAELQPARVIVVGGPDAVSEAVRVEVASLARP